MGRKRRRYSGIRFFLLRHLIISGASLDSIIKEQYYLSKYGNISYQESLMMADWERSMLLNKLFSDMKKEKDIYTI
jgi:hypothetical protein